MALRVNVDNFVRAETNRMFAELQRDAGGINQLAHNREPTPIDQQTVIRMNRDTLYSFAIVDISDGASLTIPNAGDRYVSVMVVNQDHYINRVLHEPGQHSLTVDEFDTPYVAVAVRMLVDPANPADQAVVAELQDRVTLQANSAQPFQLPNYDPDSFEGTRNAVLNLSRYTTDFARSFGRKEDVDAIKHLLGTAAGWGGLPDQEATYLRVEPELPVGEYELTVRDVPVDGFWSISVYNADGYFEPNDRGAYSVNNLTGDPNADGSVTVHFGGCGDDRPNCLPITEGWNYTVRLYRPRPEILDGRWQFPTITTQSDHS
jgi:hypothetical protein